MRKRILGSSIRQYDRTYVDDLQKEAEKPRSISNMPVFLGYRLCTALDMDVSIGKRLEEYLTIRDHISPTLFDAKVSISWVFEEIS